MKIGILIETNDYEKSWNAMRFAVTARRSKHEVKVFLMGEGVEIEKQTHDQFNTAEQIAKFQELQGEMMACGSCLEARRMEGTEGCPFSTMLDFMAMVEWADQVVSF